MRAAVVLAAGASARFGASNKLLADVGGVPLVRRAVDAALAAELDRTFVVVGGDPAVSDALPPEVVVVPSPDARLGIAHSLHAAVEAARDAACDVIVVGLGDQPGIEPEAWRAVAACDDGVIVVATYDGVRGNPVKLTADVWPLLPRDGDEGARQLMRDRPDLVVEVPCGGSPADIDTVEDLRRWS